MKARLCLLAILFLASVFCAPLLAQENSSPAKKRDWSFSAQGKFGTRLAAYKEIVWAKRKFDDERYKLSELIYEVMPAFYTGLDLSVSYKRFSLSFLNKLFFSGKTGTLKDSDWRNDDFCSNGDTFTKTDYSEHSLYLSDKYAVLAGYDLELQADFKFHPTRFLTLAPLISVNAQWMTFSAQDGTGWYGNYDKNARRIMPSSNVFSRIVYSFDGQKVLDYDVYNFFLWTGIRADFSIRSWLNISLSTEISPVSFFMDFDKHLTNERDFKENALSLCYAFRQTVKAEFKIKENLSICQTCVFVMSGESEGAMYYKKSTEEDYTRLLNNTGGGQIIYLDLELSAKFSW